MPAAFDTRRAYMADLTLTAANVLASASATLALGTFGATITAGQPLYLDTTDLDASGRGKWKLADANSATVAARTVGALSLNGGAAGQPASLVLGDPDYTHGLTGVVAGDIIILSGTAGGLAPAADLATGMLPNVVMVVTSATKAVFRITTGGAVK